MSLTKNEQILLDTLVSMETEGTLTEEMKLTLERLRSLKDKPNTITADDSDCDCPACIFNNLVYPNDLTEDERFNFAMNSVVRYLIKTNKQSMFEQLNQAVETCKEAKEIVDIQKQFFEDILSGKLLQADLNEEFQNIFLKFDEQITQEDIDNTLENTSDFLRMRAILNLDLGNLESFLTHYANCNHQIFIAALLTLKCIQQGVVATEMCRKYNQPYDKTNFCIAIMSQKDSQKRIAKWAVKLPKSNTWEEEMIIKSDNKSKLLDLLKELLDD